MSTATAQAPAGQAKVTKPRKASEQAPEHLTSAEDLRKCPFLHSLQSVN